MRAREAGFEHHGFFERGNCITVIVAFDQYISVIVVKGSAIAPQRERRRNAAKRIVGAFQTTQNVCVTSMKLRVSGIESNCAIGARQRFVKAPQLLEGMCAAAISLCEGRVD